MKLALLILCTFKVPSIQTVDFNEKLTFLTAFTATNFAKFDLYLPKWNLKQQQALIKRNQGVFKVINGSPYLGATIHVYDFTQRGSVLPGIPTDRTEKLLLIDEDTDVELLLKGVDSLPGRNIKLARFVSTNENASGDYNAKTVVHVSRCYRLVEDKNASVIEDYVMTWRPNMDIDLNLAKISGVAAQRVSFNGMKLPVAIVLSSLESMPRLEDFRDQFIDTYTKANYAPIVKLFAYFNITPEFKVFPDYKHLHDGNKFILTVTAPYMTKHLLPHVDFLKVTPPARVGFILRQPSTSFVRSIFTVTFAPGVWYATLGLLVITCAALYAFLNQEARRQNIQGITAFNVHDLMLIGLEAICQQGTSTKPVSYASRMLQVFMFLAFMFLYVAYSANILVLMQSSTALRTREELLKYGVAYAGMNTSQYSYYQPDTADILYRKNPVAPVLVSVKEGMEHVRQGIFAFYVEARYADMYARTYFNDYEVCALQDFDSRYDYGLGYAAIGKTSGYTEMFKIALFQIAEQGFAHRHYSRYFMKPICISQGSRFDSIGIRETYQAMLLVVMGVFAAFFVMAIEHILHRVQKHTH